MTGNYFENVNKYCSRIKIHEDCSRIFQTKIQDASHPVQATFVLIPPVHEIPLLSHEELSEMRTFNKVFEIGLPKTGTTSLSKAYELLGLKQTGFNQYLHSIRDTDLEKVLKAVEQFDAFQDGPWHNIDYKILDNSFPNSKFILLEREDESWYRSMEYQYSVLHQRPWFMEQTKEQIISNKHRKYKEIMDYFSDRPDDLLVMNLASDPDPWDALCTFLSLPKPHGTDEFPHVNKSPNV